MANAGDWLVLPLVRQQLHALLDRFFCASDTAGSFSLFLLGQGRAGLAAIGEKDNRYFKATASTS